MQTKSLGPIRIRFFETPVRYFYYEIFIVDGGYSDDLGDDELDLETDQQNMLSLVNQLSPKNPNTIQFVYKNEVLAKRQLNQKEIQKIAEKINKIKPEIILTPEECIDVMPDISQEIQIETYRLTYSYTWSSSEALSCPNQLKEIIDLSEFIPTLIDVDYSGLDMPMYL